MSPPEQFEIENAEIASPSSDNSAARSASRIFSLIRRIRANFTASRRTYSLEDETAPNQRLPPRKSRCKQLKWALLFILLSCMILLLIFAIAFSEDASQDTKNTRTPFFLNSTFTRSQNTRTRSRRPGNSLKELKDRAFAAQMKEYITVRGYELDCAYPRYHCYQPRVFSREACGAICRTLPSCLLMVYVSNARRQERCRLYDRTPFEMMAVPFPNNDSAMYIRRSAVGSGEQKEDGRFYFVPSKEVISAQAESVCRRGSHFYHTTLLAFDERQAVTQIAEEMERSSATNNSSEGVLLRILAGRESALSDTYADVARRVSPKLKFDHFGRVVNNKFLDVVYTNSSFSNPEYGKPYRVLCQGDPFNLKGQASFYLNLKNWAVSQNPPTNAKLLTKQLLNSSEKFFDN